MCLYLLMAELALTFSEVRCKRSSARGQLSKLKQWIWLDLLTDDTKAVVGHYRYPVPHVRNLKVTTLP